MRVAPFGDVPVLKPLRGPVPLPASGVPGRAGRLVFPVITPAWRDAARSTRWRGAGNLPRALSGSVAPGLRVTRGPEHRRDQHPEAYDRDNHHQDDPRRGAKKLLLRGPDSWRWGHVAHLLAAGSTPQTAPMPEAAA